ncbi:MAG: hypothetical protein H6912_00405 [Kordiimonadaceae bacterium]|nr:hypothetical protein [Kordiimonadaceae bacterium]
MKFIILPFILGGFLTLTIGAAAQSPVADDPLVIAAFAKSETPSGVAYREKEFDHSSKEWFDGDLNTANIVYTSAPLKESSYSWRGRREGFLGHYAKAIEIFTEGLKLFPDSYALYRYRGYYLVRNYQFDEGIADLRKAEELIEKTNVSPEQDGIPGKSNFSPSTFKRNIYYYLAQSSMATSDYNTVIEYMDKAVAANELRDKDDFLVSTSFYKYMALRALNRDEDAEKLIKAVPQQLDIIANFDYFEAVKFLQGRYSREQFLKSADSLGKYAVGMVDHFNGNDKLAKDILSEVTNNNFKGYWLAEAELLKLGS